MLAPELPQYGIIARWPEDGQSFIHPSDIAAANRCLPSERVLKRFAFDGSYYHYSYGAVRFRLRPCLWLRIRPDGIDIGDQVEVAGVGMQRDLFVASVWGMHFVQRKGCIVYRLRRADSVVPNLYTADQLKRLDVKEKVRPGMTKHPHPKWTGAGETLANWQTTDDR
ncbi:MULTISPECIES: hypothetical protein [Crateriforma]|uniref:Uncharacterized protein n=1 Tax=Crateriforma conspicua TaxID=2527996 RepID=A0A5C6FZK2_9PLAN|nr:MULTISPECIES: hypothetical protein [Crateriforma]TWU66720.1 hypothetical protein V7x_22910 [Crateriforma conspicua]